MKLRLCTKFSVARWRNCSAGILYDSIPPVSDKIFTTVAVWGPCGVHESGFPISMSSEILLPLLYQQKRKRNELFYQRSCQNTIGNCLRIGIAPCFTLDKSKCVLTAACFTVLRQFSFPFYGKPFISVNVFWIFFFWPFRILVPRTQINLLPLLTTFLKLGIGLTVNITHRISLHFILVHRSSHVYSPTW